MQAMDLATQPFRDQHDSYKGFIRQVIFEMTSRFVWNPLFVHRLFCNLNLKGIVTHTATGPLFMTAGVKTHFIAASIAA